MILWLDLLISAIVSAGMVGTFSYLLIRDWGALKYSDSYSWILATNTISALLFFLYWPVVIGYAIYDRIRYRLDK